MTRNEKQVRARGGKYHAFFRKHARSALTELEVSSVKMFHTWSERRIPCIIVQQLCYR